MLRNEKSVVDAYFVQTIDRELAELIALRRENGLDPDPIVPVDQSTAAPPAAPSPVPAKPCDRACQSLGAHHRQSTIDTLRVRWATTPTSPDTLGNGLTMSISSKRQPV